MAIQWAEVIPGTERPIGIGKTGASTCALRVSGKPIAGIVKRIPMPEVLAEAFAAELLRGWGLPVPDPYLVDESGGLAFACGQSEYPNLMQRLGADALPEGTKERTAATRVAAMVALSMTNAPLAAALDEAIDNRDRNLTNILWDGVNDAWIDHAGAFEAQTHADANKLCRMAETIGCAEVLQEAAVNRSLMIDRALPEQVRTAVSGMIDTSHQAQFVTARLNSLATRLLNRFPRPKDLLWDL